MKPVLLTFIVLLVFSGNVLAAPQIFSEQSTLSFGSLIQGKKLEHKFVIRNRGDAPLKIINIRPACGCTAANASSPLIQPGKTTEIKVSFDSANFVGNVSKTVAVETNDPATPVYTLTLTGVISEELSIKPKQISFGQLKPDVAKTSILTLENRSNKPIKLISIKTPMPQVTFKADKSLLKPGESSIVSVTITPRADDRMISGYLTLTTDNPVKSDIMVPVYGSLVRP